MSNANVLVVHIELPALVPNRLLPLGLGYIMTSLKEAGISFDFWSHTSSIEKKYFSLPNPDFVLNSIVLKDLSEYLKGNAYDIICLSGLPQAYNIIKATSKCIKDNNPDNIVVVGGTLATFSSDMLLSCSDVDIAVIGEGEITIVDLIHTIENKKSLACVSGIHYKYKGKIIKNDSRPPIEDLATLPFVDFSLFGEDLVNKALPSWCSSGSFHVNALPVSTARGCIGNCSFCIHAFKQYKYRQRPVSAILKEIDHLIYEYNVGGVYLSDELTFSTKDQVEIFCKSIMRNKLEFTWECNCRGNLFNQHKDLDILLLMKDVGCNRVLSSIESANERILKEMRKGVSVEEFSFQYDLIKKAGLKIGNSFIFGYPSETPRTIETSIDWFISHPENDPPPGMGFLHPHPGSYMFEYAVKHGFITSEEDYLLSPRNALRQYPHLNMTTMEDEQLFSLVREGLLRYIKEVGIQDKYSIGDDSLYWGNKDSV